MKRFVVTLSLLLSMTTWVYAQVVHIPDPNLRAAVREALELPHDEPITREAMLQLTRLHVQGRGISDLTGLEFAQNLQDLNIGHNPISDIATVGSLTNLIVLLAHYCGFADVAPLATLTRLKHLSLHGNEISDIAPLAKLTRLEHINLHRNRISDVAPLVKLTRLKHLSIYKNVITDHSLLDGLALEHFTHDLDTPCDMPPLPLAPRIEDRTFPSFLMGWSDRSIWPSYDLIWCCPSFDTTQKKTDQGFQFSTHHPSWDGPIGVRNAYIEQNATMVFLYGIPVVWRPLDLFPADSPWWLRDENGEILPAWDKGLMNLNHPGWQQRIVDIAVAVDQCGLYDGIFIDGWAEPSNTARGQLPGQVAILKGIRERVRDDFLIMVNTNEHQSPASAPYINGLFMETVFPYRESTPEGIEKRLTKIENTLAWAEESVRYPRINSLIGRPYDEPLDSPVNLQWMRAFITLSLTFSDGYVHFMTTRWDWHDFWDADLGQPVGETLQLYEERPGLYIREFTKGWAVYNHSGAAQIVTLPEEVQSAATGFSNTTHAILDLDGDIFLRVAVELPGDLNSDGVVTILDLVIVAQAMGTDRREADVNGDGVINVFDLVFVANQF